ncbi:MAG: DNA-directed RNA polymerase subunit beta' [Acidimicrobiales bacterium]|nr:MAG: DNA-directed RNA polymerase subunit beta' [Actinomycetota bacterium]MBV6510059.1 DNA-directed RNA polymerase subunit beta' [Acidimicrobiales bacterium]RIK02839.1 MAG: DNA-directed RNA polymerase subunit beta' [Acidobacteriota bacterium]
MLDVNNFDQLKIGLATAGNIRMWSNGEVKKPETINYRTLKPEKDGLFCEKIFGPTKDWECACGKYKRVRFKGIICERCGVEVTRSKVRRERMGHIELAAPTVHIWYLRGTRSWLAYLLMGTEVREELKAKQLEKVIYFAANLVTSVDEEKRHEDLPSLEAEMIGEKDAIDKDMELELAKVHEELENEIEELEEQGAKDSEIKARQRAVEKDLASIRERYEGEKDLVQRAFDEFKDLFSRQIIEDEMLWRELEERYGDYFEGGMGADAIAQLIDRIDLDEEELKLRDLIDPPEGQRPLSAQRKQKAIKRLKIVTAFNRRDDNDNRVNDPRAMILDVVPVIPPELRPMVQLDGGRFATSDLNDLYRRVINRNNRLKRLLDLGAPEIIVNNEKRMLQEAVDALFDNGRRGRPVTGPGNRPLKSLSDMLKGKQGRFRQNLLGKRVDYSGRSVIVIGPTLKLHQCGLPKLMALELFKPFVMKALVDRELAQNIKSAKRMVERRRPQVWDVLEEVIKEHPVLLNRAPTLHRLGIQAFEPVLVEGKAIQIHPLVCTAFNADFDGDQMAVHLPLSAEAQAESRVLMLSANNVLSPAHGRPLVTPTQDMIIGTYYLTEEVDGAPGEGRVFRRLDEMERAFDAGEISLHAKITYRAPELRVEPANDSVEYHPTTFGRVLFNRALPDDFGYVNRAIRKRDMSGIVDRLALDYSKADVAHSLDNIKELSFFFAMQSGLTMSIDDVQTPDDKQTILDEHEDEAEKVEKQFRKGIITDGERIQKEVEIWTTATERVRAAMEQTLKSQRFNPIDMMVGSGARGNMMQVRQIAGMRGLVANPRGDMIPRPIKSNFREGLSVLEYFIATPGARKGLVDTALRTADSGYLTRRLVDVAQELIINDTDPFENGGPLRGIWIEKLHPDGYFDTEDNYVGDHAQNPSDSYQRTYLETRLFSRTLAQDVKLSDGTVLAAGSQVLEEQLASLRDDPEIDRVRVLSPLTDDSPFGISAASYGTSLATGKPIEVGEAVGVIAAQSIGEPGTQLTMRTFHTGGIAGRDIAGGLPRVVELFEARSPRGKATLSRTSGVVRVGEDDGKGRVITVVGDDGDEEVYTIPQGSRLEVVDGQEVTAGDALVEGPRDPKELLEIRGVRETQQYIVEEVQRVYRDQGVSIHDKHIELIVRQMTRRIAVQEPGDSDFLPGERVDQWAYADANRQLVQEGKRPAEGRPELMGITKASLATDSWLSAASFQETTRVLTEAAIESKSDSLRGLKENIIIGKLIPAGTGMPVYRNIETFAPDYQPLEFWSSEEEADPAAWLASLGAGEGGDGAGGRVIDLQTGESAS